MGRGGEARVIERVVAVVDEAESWRSRSQSSSTRWGQVGEKAERRDEPTTKTIPIVKMRVLGLHLTDIGVKTAVLVGGVDMMAQALALAQRPHVIVGTPGRVVDHLTNTKGERCCRRLRVWLGAITRWLALTTLLLLLLLLLGQGFT